MTGLLVNRIVLGEVEPFTWWGAAGFGHVPFYLIVGPFACLVILAVSLIVNRTLKANNSTLPPDPSQMGVAGWITWIFEAIVEAMVDLLDSLMPNHHEGRHYAFLIIPLFFYILVNNVLG